ncbi:hypothetical protein G6553_20540, partial [Nocardioides sp. IC4_145]|uniref:hypothetical protein n=1 Tax=Nocardioides sp. IC4_145 TaxID=2714037 RepID=UPI001A985608
MLERLPTPIRRGSAASAVLLLAGLALQTPATAAPGQTTAVDDGAVTLLDVSLDGAGLPQLWLSAGDRVQAPDAEPVLVDGDLARTAGSDVPGYGTGSVTPADDEVFVVPEVLTPGLPTLGWSTLRLPGPAVGTTAAEVSLDLTVSGPGGVVVLDRSVPAEPTVLADTRDSVPDELRLPAATSGWQAWVFEEPGRYDLTVVPELHAGTGVRVGSPARYVVEVSAPTAAPEPPPAPAPDVPAPAPH